MINHISLCRTIYYWQLLANHYVEPYIIYHLCLYKMHRGCLAAATCPTGRGWGIEIPGRAVAGDTGGNTSGRWCWVMDVRSTTRVPVMVDLTWVNSLQPVLLTINKAVNDTSYGTALTAWPQLAMAGAHQQCCPARSHLASPPPPGRPPGRSRSWSPRDP